MANSSPHSLSVSKVRLAFECPRLLYLGHHQGGMMMFVSAKTSLGIGQDFHRLSDACVQQLRTDATYPALLSAEVEALDVATVAQGCQQQLYRTVFFPFLQQAIVQSPDRTSALHQLWQGLRGLIYRWATLLVSNRRFCLAEEVLSKTFLAQELPVSHEFGLLDGERQWVQGRLDSLVYDFSRHRLCVVEYKTYQSPDPAAQLAQVALYTYMLRLQLGVPIDSAVYSVLPDWQERVYSWSEIEATVQQVLGPKLAHIRTWLAWLPGQGEPPPKAQRPELCDMCPKRTTCETFFEPAAKPIGLIMPTPTSEKSGLSKPVQPRLISSTSDPTQPKQPRENSKKSHPSPPAPDPIAAEVVESLAAFNVAVTCQGVVRAPAFVRVKLKPQAGVKVSALLKLRDDLRVQLGLIAPPLIAPQTGYVSVDLPRPDRQTACFNQYVTPQSNPAAPVRIAIGVNLEGELVEADLAEANTCHFLVGGTTGSGKSEFLRALLLSLVQRHSPDRLQLVLVDPKRVTFPEFEGVPWLRQPIVKDTEMAIDLMATLTAEMDDRYRRFEANHCTDLAQYNQVAAPLPRLVCLFDEYADFMAEKESRIALEQSIKRLGAMARAAGIHLIIATQRPDSRVVTPLIRSNLPGRIALKTASEADSQIILGGKQGEAANLLGKGDLLYLQGGTLVRLQSLFAQQIEL